MAQIIHHDPVALAYAGSLLELASESGADARIGAELKDVRQLLKDNESIRLYFADPSVSSEERSRTIKSAFSGRVSTLVLNTILVLNSKGRLSFLGQVADAYQTLMDEKLGNIEVDVTVASELNSSQIEEVRQLINKGLGKNAVIRQQVDESIIGGLILKVGDRQIDGSVKTQLNKIREKLLLSKAK